MTSLDMRGVEIVAHGVVVGRGGYDYKVGVAIGRRSVKGGCEIERLFGEIFFDILVLDGRLTAVDHLNLFGDYVDGCNMIVLSQKCGYTQAYVTGAGYGYIIFFHKVMWGF